MITNQQQGNLWSMFGQTKKSEGNRFSPDINVGGGFLQRTDMPLNITEQTSIQYTDSRQDIFTDSRQFSSVKNTSYAPVYAPSQVITIGSSGTTARTGDVAGASLPFTQSLSNMPSIFAESSPSQSSRQSSDPDQSSESSLFGVGGAVGLGIVALAGVLIFAPALIPASRDASNKAFAKSKMRRGKK